MTLFNHTGERSQEEYGEENGIKMPVLRYGADAGEELQRDGVDLP